MRIFISHNKVKLTLLIVVILLISYLAISAINRQTMTISIDRESVSHIVIYYGISPRKVDYSEHKVALDSVFDMLSGDYDYSGTWRRPDTAGTGMCSIFLYNQNKELICTINYMNNRVYIIANQSIPHNSKMYANKMYAYRHKTNIIDFSDFYAYMDGNNIAWTTYIG